MKCDLPGPTREVGLKHGGGGPAMRALIESIFAVGFGPTQPPGVGLEAMDDGAAIPVGDRFLVVTTDSHVVHPYRFPGGDIGRLAVAGTVNDLAVMGTTELLGLTCSVVLQEGFALDELESIWRSIRDTCAEVGVSVVTGDTKVMGHRELDGIVINTCGFGWAPRVVRDAGLQPGDQLIVTGTLGDHGLAVLAARNDLELEGHLASDVAPLFDLVGRALHVGGSDIVAMKDPTRGGLVGALKEMASKSRVGIVIEEARIPLLPEVVAAGELLGIDPLHVANEGKAVIAVKPEKSREVLAVLRDHPLGKNAAIIGQAVRSRPGSLVLDTGFGKRLLGELDGEPLPRIC